MKKQILIVFVAFIVPLVTLSQVKNKKIDSSASAKEMIQKNSGEKDLSKQLQKEQLKKNPELLTKDSANGSASNKRHKTKCKHKNSGK